MRALRPEIGHWRGGAQLDSKRKRMMSDSICLMLEKQESLKRTLKLFDEIERYARQQATLHARLGGRAGMIEAQRQEEVRRDAALGLLRAEASPKPFGKLNAMVG
jgi:hypothetical protein